MREAVIIGGKNMSRNKKIALLVSIVLIVIAGICVYKLNYKSSYLYSQEYLASIGNIKGHVNMKYFTDRSADFEIGANSFGYAVFKNPNAAFARLQTDYGKGIDLIQKEFKLAPLSKKNYEPYKALGGQVTTGTDEEKKQAAFVSAFIDIYENSYSIR